MNLWDKDEDYYDPVKSAQTFVTAFVRLPCQLVRTGRQLVYRLLGWNPYQPIFFRLVAALRC